MDTFKIDLKEVNFSDLTPTQKKNYIRLLKERNIKMTYDIETDKYIALVEVEKD